MGEEKEHRHRALRYHTLPTSPTQTLSVCTGASDAPKHKPTPGAQHCTKNTLGQTTTIMLTYLKYHFNIKFYQTQMVLMVVCSASFSVRSDVCQG